MKFNRFPDALNIITVQATMPSFHSLFSDKQQVIEQV